MSADSLLTKGWVQAQDLFYTDFNDVSIFVEDQDKENLYFCLLRSSIPNLRIEKIFPLGGKGPCLEHLRANPDPSLCAYIVDKDWDDLLGVIVPHPNLIYLDRHSIESYFLDHKKGHVELIGSCHPAKRFDVIERKVEFDK